MKTQILGLKPYQPGKSPEQIKKEYNVERVTKLASNENPFGYSPKAAVAVQNVLLTGASYPDGNAGELRKVLSRSLGVKENQLLFGSGLDEVIQTLSRFFLCEGDNIVTADETFPQYKHHAVIEGCEVREIPLAGGCFDLDEMAGAVDSRTKLVWICNPNNPTGTYVNEEELFHFLQKIPEQTVVVIDEAYYEFVCAGDFPETIPLLKRFSNLLILRTFSKAYGLAGFRIGYAIGHEGLIEKINIARLPFNTTAFAQAAAVAAMEDRAFLDYCIEENRNGIERFLEVLQELGIGFYPTQTNFIFIKTDQPAEWFEMFIEKGFIVRPFPKGVRITIGTKEQNEGVLSIIRSHIGAVFLARAGEGA